MLQPNLKAPNTRTINRDAIDVRTHSIGTHSTPLWDPIRCKNIFAIEWLWHFRIIDGLSDDEEFKFLFAIGMSSIPEKLQSDCWASGSFGLHSDEGISGEKLALQDNSSRVPFELLYRNAKKRRKNIFLLWCKKKSTMKSERERKAQTFRPPLRRDHSKKWFRWKIKRVSYEKSLWLARRCLHNRLKWLTQPESLRIYWISLLFPASRLALLSVCSGGERKDDRSNHYCLMW